MERRSVPREPAIDRFLNRREQPQPVSPGKHRPAASHVSPHAIHRRSPLRPRPIRSDDPGRVISLLAGDAVASEHASLLVRDGQHTAGPVAPAAPERHPGSNASSPVEQEDEAGLAHATIQPTNPTSAKTAALRPPWTRAIDSISRERT